MCQELNEQTQKLLREIIETKRQFNELMRNDVRLCVCVCVCVCVCACVYSDFLKNLSSFAQSTQLQSFRREPSDMRRVLLSDEKVWHTSFYQRPMTPVCVDCIPFVSAQLRRVRLWPCPSIPR
jgi:hypothetical protein